MRGSMIHLTVFGKFLCTHFLWNAILQWTNDNDHHLRQFMIREKQALENEITSRNDHLTRTSLLQSAQFDFALNRAVEHSWQNKPTYRVPTPVLNSNLTVECHLEAYSSSNNGSYCDAFIVTLSKNEVSSSHDVRKSYSKPPNYHSAHTSSQTLRSSNTNSYPVKHH